jgi:two-component system chemotaxis response regulator CheY
MTATLTSEVAGQITMRNRSDCRLLLIEDDFGIRQILAETLLNEGFQVTSTADGLEALQHLRSRTRPMPDVIVLDLVLPRLSGWQFLADLEGDTVLGKIPVVIVSANTYDPAILPTAPNVVGHLVKPIDMTQLIALIDESYAKA